MVFFLGLTTADSTVPDWWGQKQVLSAGVKDDYAVANLGQLKTIARKAAQQMDECLLGGAGTAIDAMIASWETNPPPAGAVRDDYAALTLGQLKTVAKMFHQRLQQVGIAFAPPVGQAGSDDYAMANLGQLKTMFAFPITKDIVGLDGDDFDIDGLTNGQELALGTNLRLADTDGDGLKDGQEVTLGTNPKVKDTDGDGLEDGQEVALGTNPKVKDTDGDGIEDAQELLAGTNPKLSDTDGDGVSDGQEVALETNPLLLDTDHDGLGDGQELTLGTNPKVKDTDGDGVSDGQEVADATDPNDNASTLPALLGLRVFTPLDPL